MAKGRRKGHGKKIDPAKFDYALQMFFIGQWTMQHCADYCEVSYPTICKYFNMRLRGEAIDKSVLDYGKQ